MCGHLAVLAAHHEQFAQCDVAGYLPRSRPLPPVSNPAANPLLPVRTDRHTMKVYAQSLGRRQSVDRVLRVNQHSPQVTASAPFSPAIGPEPNPPRNAVAQLSSPRP